MGKNIALVLGSGGARGIAHIGVINELVRQGYNITSISGTSMGALVGGMYATGELQTFEKWLCSLRKRDVLNLVDFTLSLNGIVKGKKILEEMKKMVPDRNIEDLLLPYSAVATDIINGKEIIFNKGSLYDAIRASISIPTVFTPFEYNGLKLVDGGVLNPIPINAVKRTEDDMLVVVNVGGDEKNIPTQTSNKSSIKNIKYLSKIQEKLDNIIPKNKSDKIGYYNLLNKTTSLMVQKISNLTLKEYQPDVLIEIAHNSFGTYEFYKSKEIINTGVIETRKALNNIKTH